MTWDKAPASCPACRAVLSAPDAKDCAACGIVFEKWRRKQAQGADDGGGVRPGGSGDSGGSKLAGAAAALAAIGLAAWMLRASPSRPDAPGAKRWEAYGFSLTPPSGWIVEERPVRPKNEGCTLLVLRREGPKDRLQPSLSLNLPRREAGELAWGARSKLAVEFRAVLADGLEASSASSDELRIDGLPAVRARARGKRHMRVETSARVATNAQAYLHEQARQHPGQGVYVVMAQVDYSRRNSNPYVVLKEAEYAEFDAEPVVGRLAVPSGGELLFADWQHDASDAAASDEIEAALSSLRLHRHPIHWKLLGLLGSIALVATGFLLVASIVLLT